MTANSYTCTTLYRESREPKSTLYGYSCAYTLYTIWLEITILGIWECNETENIGNKNSKINLMKAKSLQRKFYNWALNERSIGMHVCGFLSYLTVWEIF